MVVIGTITYATPLITLSKYQNITDRLQIVDLRAYKYIPLIFP